MADTETKKKWDQAAPWFDLMAGTGAERRWFPAKHALFSRMQGDVLFLAAGTGLDFVAFPAERRVVAIDISAGMLRYARPRAAQYKGRIDLMEMDVNQLAFADASFDQVFTSCTFCSVPNPVSGLEQLRRVLRPGGKLHMFEHTGSHYFPFNLMLNLMNPLAKRTGPEMNRNTVGNVQKAGFKLLSVNHLYLDVVKTIVAENPKPSRAP